MHTWDTESLAIGQAGRECASEISFLAQPRTHTAGPLRPMATGSSAATNPACRLQRPPPAVCAAAARRSRRRLASESPEDHIRRKARLRAREPFNFAGGFDAAR